MLSTAGYTITNPPDNIAENCTGLVEELLACHQKLERKSK